MIVNIKGIITAALQKKTGVSQQGSAWAVQEFVVTDERNDAYCFEVFGEDNIQKFSIGLAVDIACILSCKEWNGKYYTKLRYYSPKEENATQPTNTTQAAPQPTPTQNAAPQYAQPQPVNFAQTAQDNDGLPF